MEGGQQPLSDDSGDIQVVVNGELYDFKNIREDLKAKGHKFKTECDSEIALHLYKEYGMSFTDHLRGEFAICIYDNKSQKVILVRDHYSIKPLYYTVVNNTLLFASELKAFLALGWKPEWDIDSMVHQGWLFDNRTCFKGVYKVPSAHYVVATSSGTITVKPYWDMDFRNKYEKDTRSVNEMIEGVRERLIDSVRQRLVTDVPLAVFLSGGLDSSSVAGIATHLLRQQNPDARVKAFTISFADGGIYDEGEVAKRTAEYLGADLEILSLTEDDLLEGFADSVWHIEAPYFNLNTVARRKMAKRVRDMGYKVVLTGEGSDEHFGGYIYFQGNYLSEQDHALPSDFETLSENQRKEKLKLSNAVNFNRYMSSVADFGESGNGLSQYVSQAAFASCTVLSTKYLSQQAIEQCGSPNLLKTLHDSADGVVRRKMKNEWHPMHSAMYTITRTFMSNYILCNAGDRCDMESSVESRTPFLDHHLTEYAMGLPPSVKVKGDPVSGKLTEKWILKEAARPFITEELYKRTKEPFIAPMARGHNETFVSLVEKYLTKENIDNIGWLDFEVVERSKKQYLEEGSSNNRDHQDMLILMSMVILSQKFNVLKYKYIQT